VYSDIPDKNATEGPRGWLFYNAACRRVLNHVKTLSEGGEP